MPRSLVVSGGPEQQRPDERVAYRVVISATSYPSASSPVAALWDVTDTTAVDVTATKLSGSSAIGAATIEDVVYPQVFTSPLVIALVAGRTYRLEFQFVSGGATFEPYLLIGGVA